LGPSGLYCSETWNASHVIVAALSSPACSWGSRRDDAQQEARESLTLATSNGERQAAQQLIDFFDKNKAPGASH
jgi:hypothetical protein